MVPHVVENTVNALIADYLRSKGVHVTTEYSGRTSEGRKQPDFFLRNSGSIFGEGEWQSSSLKGLKQAHEYSALPGAIGSFIISYPEEIRDIVRRRLRDS